MELNKRLLPRTSCLQAAVVPNSLAKIFEKAPTGRFFYSRVLYGTAGFALAMSWLHPNHYPPWVVFENEMLAFAGLGLAVVARCIRGGAYPWRGIYVRLLYAIAAVVLMQYGLGVISWQNCALGVVYLVAFAAAVGLGQAWRGDVCKRAIYENGALLVTLFAILLSAAVVLAQGMKIDGHYPGWVAASGEFRPFGNLGQPNNQGTLLVTGVLLVEMLRRRKILSAVAASVILFVLLPAIVMTGSRTALLSALLASAYLACVGRRRDVPFTMGWLAILLVLYAISPWFVSLLGGQSEGRLMESMGSSPRLHIYQQLLGAIAENPWMGYGWMQTAYAQSVASIHIHGGYEATYAHNFVLDWVTWFGMPFGFLSIGFAVFLFVSNWRNAPMKNKLTHTLLLPFIVHSMLEFPYAYAFFLLPFGMLLGYLSTSEWASYTDNFWRRRLNYGLYLLSISFASVLGILVSVDYMQLAEDFRVLRFENKKVGSLPAGFEMTKPWVLTDLRDGFDAFRYTPRAGESSEQIAKIQKIAMRDRFPAIHVKLISVYVLNNRLDDAEFEFNRFRNLYGSGVVKWGQGILQDAYCLGDKVNMTNIQRACGILQGPS